MERLIQQRAGSGKSKLLEKGMKTPSSLVIDLLTSISNCYYCREIHKEGCQSSPWQQKLLVPSHVPPNLDLSIWSISKTWSWVINFFCLLWATGLVGFNWNLLHNLFHFDNGTQYIHVHFVLFAVCWNWFLVSTESARGESRKFSKGWLGHLPTSQLYRNVLLFWEFYKNK